MKSEGLEGYHWCSLSVSHHPALGQTPLEQQEGNCTAQQLSQRGFPRITLPRELPAARASDSAPLQTHVWHRLGGKGIQKTRQPHPATSTTAPHAPAPLPPILQWPSASPH